MLEHIITTKLLQANPEDNVIVDLWGQATKEKLVPQLLRELKYNDAKSKVSFILYVGAYTICFEDYECCFNSHFHRRKRCNYQYRL